MHSADDCRQHAKECLASAENACSGEDWIAFINLACDWIRAAGHLDGDFITGKHQVIALVRNRIESTSKN